MNIVYEVLRKLNYLKPNEIYNERVLSYFLKSSLINYFNESDKYEITINIKNNYLEIANLSTAEEYFIEKKNNSLDFINKNNNEILFHISYNNDKLSLVEKKAVKIVKINEDSEQYSLINNINGNITTLSDLKVKISNKEFYELKNNQKTKIVGLILHDEDKYDQIFSYLNQQNLNEKKGVRKRILNLF